ncbi:MAG TPA: histidine triad nucleotide-binding protein [Woeseiaceae bacterium]|nr:histidine triad nucleotide-binding protein [Woeseiaceae bacterium]
MSDKDCLFCKIVDGNLDADIVYENDSLIAFRDIDPKAPTHILLIPRRHIATMNDLQHDDEGLVGELFVTATKLAADEGLADDGYRVVMNCNEAAGQSVFHIHLHLMGGRKMTWPPG